MQNGQIIGVGVAGLLFGGAQLRRSGPGAQIHGDRVAAGTAVIGLIENGADALAVVRMTRRLVLQHVGECLLRAGHRMGESYACRIDLTLTDNSVTICV